MQYEFQRSRVDPHMVVELLDDGIQVTPDDAPQRLVPYGDIAMVRLSFEQGRALPERHACTVELRSGETLFFDSMAYQSFFSAFKPTDYRPFVEELHARLLGGNHPVQYMAGDKTGRFALQVLITIGIAVVGLASLVVVSDKPWWTVMSALLLFGGLLWNQVRVLRRNETRHYDPHAIPPDLMPEVA